MMLERCGLAVALFAVCGTWVVGALAGDEDSEPLFVIHNGKRVPTVIIPPRADPGDGLRPAGLQLRELDPEADVRPPGADRRDDPAPPDDAAVAVTGRPGHPRDYVTGHYAGYPVSIPRLPPPGWPYAAYGSYPPPKYYGQVLRETYRARRWIRDRERGRVSNVRDMKRRETRILANHERALRVGVQHLKSGDYPQAVIALTMAARLNQGDPACRIHLAQARLVQGHYEEAGRALRRALQLQPKLVYVDLHLEKYYPSEDVLGAETDELVAWVKHNRAGAETYFLLGVLEFQRGNFETAYAAFRRTARQIPKDPVTESYLEITKPARK